MASKGCTSPRANKETQAFLCDKHSSGNIRLVLRTHTLLHIPPQKQPVARRSKNNHILIASFFFGLSWMRPQEEKWCSAQESVPSDKRTEAIKKCAKLIWSTVQPSRKLVSLNKLIVVSDRQVLLLLEQFWIPEQWRLYWYLLHWSPLGWV